MGPTVFSGGQVDYRRFVSTNTKQVIPDSGTHTRAQPRAALQTMENPGMPPPATHIFHPILTSIAVEDIPGVMRSLCQGNRAEQTAVLESHFLPNASFLHPFCRVPSFLAFPAPCMRVQSRQVILAIYRWYRLLSPRIELCIDSCGEEPCIRAGRCRSYSLVRLTVARSIRRQGQCPLR